MENLASKQNIISDFSWIIATHNPGKLKEIQEILAGIVEPENIVSASSLNLLEPEETGSTFSENAILKATAARDATNNMIALADDSGLEVDILDGAPGIYSARWGGEKKDFSLAMKKVKQEIENKGKKTEGQKARFICVISVALPSGEIYDFEGKCEGSLTFPPRGNHGFGYDPIFIPEGYDKTFAEIDGDIKQNISHRKKACDQLRRWIEGYKS